MKCDMTSLIPDYLAGELAAAEVRQLHEHAGNCRTCAETLAAFEGIHKGLVQSRRPQPGRELLSRYHEDLDALFPQESFWARVIEFGRGIFTAPGLAPALGRSTAITALGLVLGWFLFQSGAPETPLQAIQPKHGLRLASQDLALVKTLFEESQAVLQDVLATSAKTMEQPGERARIQKAAQKLLMKTFAVHELALQLQNTDVLDFLTKLELVLHELANLPEEDIDETFPALQNLIREIHLLKSATDFQQAV